MTLVRPPVNNKNLKNEFLEPSVDFISFNVNYVIKSTITIGSTDRRTNTE